MEKYRSRILIMTCLFYGAVVGVIVNTNGQFYPSIADSLGVPIGDVTMASLIMGLAALICTPLVTGWYQKRDARLFSLAATMVFLLSHFLCGLVTKLWQFYVLSAVRGAVQGFLMFYLVSTLIKSWFGEQSGAKLGIAALSSGITGMAANTLIGLAIDRWSWRVALCGSAVAAFVLGIPLLALYMVRSPKEWEERQRRGGKEVSPEVDGASAKKTEMSDRRGETGHPGVLVCGLVMTLLWLIPFSLTQHLKIYAMGQGFSQMFGANLMTLTMVGNLLSKLYLSIYADRLGARKMAVGVIGLLLAGDLLLLAPATATLSVGAILLGISTSVTAVLVPQVTAYVYTGDQFDRVFAWFSMVMSLGNALWISVDGILYDRLGSYVPVFAGAAVLLAVSMVLFAIFAGSTRKE
ncbi:MAG: MFS transporter [Lachnospiraceae bacterium]|nr:MFS transporter [Lachnospiraceae bacterium]